MHGKVLALTMKCIVWIIASAFGVLIISAKPALACVCAAPAGPAEGLNRSSAVFRGRMSEISLPFLDRIGLTTSGCHRLKFAVVKQWKGTTSKTVEVTTRLTGEACGFPFELNKEYLVYVVAEPRDVQTGICTGTKSITDAEPKMKQLDEIVSAGKR